MQSRVMVDVATFSLQSTSFTSADLDAIAEMHVREIPGGFMSSIGTGLMKLVFETIANETGCVLIAARESGGRIVGFVAGAGDVKLLYRAFLLRNGFRAVAMVLPHLCSMRVLRRLVETLFYPARSYGEGLPVPELTDIAVSREFIGTGLAQRLFHGFADAMRQRGHSRFKVGTGESLLRAQRFYERLGGRRAGRVEIHRGAGSVYFIYDVRDARA